MKRPRTKTYIRERSTNPVTNIFGHRCGKTVERTNSKRMFADQINSASVNITPLRVSF